ncbi:MULTISPECIES: flagellar transcriptional regulator FlhD [unclassified Burkholderia]|nr:MULTISPECIES: flagellar transcriptional regulator FlhD [unclassified Burkholderia]RQS29204.1 flagellar transcriptional regulator FlhD [Burkholderia sp. Bp8990]RQR28819.1 flagellar transcriptional regulator FlhD [Burkholderia sp. Bp9131]RQR60548.1 flagellar transcriptional regulator FlhD [Burkholderia sp. Bp9015]RQR69861.1 flagellar transcriptional regulator FlhD [Burkholderia sp. Bp9011]RQR82958.1 flagellar transcriptional regulator FlhD [Burkholderia sp. Bp9010]
MPEQDDIFDAIAEFNRSYLTLAQRLLQADREAAKQQLGMSDETAAIVAELTPAQIDELAERRELFCEFRAESSPGRA